MEATVSLEISMSFSLEDETQRNKLEELLRDIEAGNFYSLYDERAIDFEGPYDLEHTLDNVKVLKKEFF